MFDKMRHFLALAMSLCPIAGPDPTRWTRGGWPWNDVELTMLAVALPHNIAV
jgi:hypothetical protein